MLYLPHAAGPHDPVRATPARPAGSVRRTSTIDTLRPDGLRGGSVVAARARDLRTGRSGSAQVLGEVTLAVRLAPGATVERIESSPAAGLADLVGARVGSGFRRRVADAVPAEHDGCTLLHLLLDDLPGATLVSGYAVQRGGALGGLAPAGAGAVGGRGDRGGADAGDGGGTGGDGRRRVPIETFRDDICAGWVGEGSMMSALREHGQIPVPMGPPAPSLADPADPVGWHPLDPLPPHGMRRARRLDLVAPATGDGGGWRVEAHFRDSHVDGDGHETVVHEYTVAGSVDPVAGTVVSMAARAQVLPWTECPGAVDSAGRLAGMSLAELRARVRRELVGRTTCTHLNDTLRALADVSALAELLGDGVAD